MLVAHDADDHGWQFLGSSEARREDAKLVCLEAMVRRDPALWELADLPPGWQATRANSAAPWQRSLSPKEEGEPASFAHDGYELDAISQDRRADYPFELPNFPSEEDREGLGPGDLVKLIFRYAEPDESADAVTKAERMWVEMGEVDGERLIGTLDSDPRHTKRLKSGDAVWFERRHVVQIWRADG